MAFTFNLLHLIKMNENSLFISTFNTFTAWVEFVGLIFFPVTVEINTGRKDKNINLAGQFNNSDH